MKFACSIVALAMTTALASLTASAQSLPVAQYGGSVTIGDSDGYTNYSIVAPYTYTYTASDNKGGAASTTLTILDTPSPFVSLTSSSSTPFTFNADAETGFSGTIEGGYIGSMFSYNVEFLGPAGSVPVQVNADVGASLSATAPGARGIEYSGASFYVFNPSSQEIFGDLVAISGASGFTSNYGGTASTLSYDSTSGISGQVDDSHVWLAQTGVVYTVDLGLAGGTSVSGNYLGGNMFQSSYVDPTFEIAGGAPNANLYSVLTSPGIGNGVVAAVPEPSTYAAMLSGLGFISVLMWRRRAAGEAVSLARVSPT